MRSWKAVRFINEWASRQEVQAETARHNKQELERLTSPFAVSDKALNMVNGLIDAKTTGKVKRIKNELLCYIAELEEGF